MEEPILEIFKGYRIKCACCEQGLPPNQFYKKKFNPYPWRQFNICKECRKKLKEKEITWRAPLNINEWNYLRRC